MFTPETVQDGTATGGALCWPVSLPVPQAVHIPWFLSVVLGLAGCTSSGSSDHVNSSGATEDQNGEGVIAGIDSGADRDDTGSGGSVRADDPLTRVGDDSILAPPAPDLDESGDSCGPLEARVRDFQGGHPDFEAFEGTEAYRGIVEDELGEDHTPVYAAAGATPQTSGPENFAQWYRDVEGVNEGFDIEIPMEENGEGLFVYDNSAFFPIDGRGFGNEGNAHNYHFTTEIHTTFTYRGGELFRFVGDDDLWLFVNGKLAIDLGGLHPRVEDTVDFDAMADQLDIETGESYPMDIFHAERHTTESNFRVETSIECFLPPDLQ